MKPEYKEQIDIISAYHPDDADNRQAAATLAALIASDSVAAAEAQVVAAQAQAEAAKSAAVAADRQADRLVSATKALVVVTFGPWSPRAFWCG